MKKQTTIGFAIAILFVAAIGLYACKGQTKTETKAKTEAGVVTITLKAPTADFLHQLSAYSTDSLYLKAVDAAVEKQRTDTTNSFIDLFYSSWNELAPDERLASIFGTYELRDYIRPDATNDEVIAVLYDEWDMAFSNTINVLRYRIDRYEVKPIGLDRVGNSDTIRLKLSKKVKNPDRLASLLAQPGELEIWETYNNAPMYGDPGVFDMLAKADTLLNEQLQANKPAAENDAINRYPLFSILQPSVDDASGTPYQSGCVGIAAIGDTAAVNQMLGIAGKHDIFPANLRFLWSTKSYGGNEGYVDLVAIKVSTLSGDAPIDGSVITDAKIEEQEWGWDVLFTMNTEGTRTFSRLTAYNINRVLAIVMDGKVLSYPIVASEVEGGRCVISGNKTKEEAKDLANLLKSGKLPMPVQLIAVTTKENTAKQ